MGDTTTRAEVTGDRMAARQYSRIAEMPADDRAELDRLLAGLAAAAGRDGPKTQWSDAEWVCMVGGGAMRLLRCTQLVDRGGEASGGIPQGGWWLCPPFARPAFERLAEFFGQELRWGAYGNMHRANWGSNIAPYTRYVG